MDPSNEISLDFSPFFRVYKDGRIERLLTLPRLPSSTDSATGVQSKDVTISSNPQIEARIFIPKLAGDPPQKLPLLVHFHGGAFCIGSAFNIVTQSFLTPLVSQIPAVAVAVGYRLAPETPLPAAYHDCWAAIQWIASHASGSGPEPWINNHADLARVYLTGESAGANLAHHVAVQAGVNSDSVPPGLTIRGLVAVHPYFSQKEPDKLIQYLYPGSSGSDDDPKLNPNADPNLEKMGCSRVLIVVAGKDQLKPRGVGYKETLERSNWKGSMELMENEGEDHCFHLMNPASDEAKRLIERSIRFIKQDA